VLCNTSRVTGTVWRKGFQPVSPFYGSEGWGFESLRACCGSPCSARAFTYVLLVEGTSQGNLWEPFAARTTSIREITLAPDPLLGVRFVPAQRSSGSGQAGRLRVLAHGIDLVCDEAMSFPVDGVRRL
jgi:hypothetical protein